MKVDNPNALRFLLQDEIYLLKDDKAMLAALPQEMKLVPAGSTPAMQPAAEPSNIPVAAVLTPVLSKPEIKHPEPVLETPERPINYLGNNNKSFVVLVSYAGNDLIEPGHLSALENILKRKGYALDDVAVVNIRPYAPLTMARLMEAFKPLKLLIMGQEALPQGIGNLPLNKPVQGKKTHVLYSFSFDEMMSSNDNKKAFWDQMKTL